MEIGGLKFTMEDEVAPQTLIKVIGVGGGGSNAVARMLTEGLAGIDFAVLNTDSQALSASPVATKLSIGPKITHGLGAGSDPLMGRQAALEDTERIIDLLEGAEMVFVTVGLGGGTGTGAAPVVASLAKELGALTVAVVTKPFSFEGPKRRRQAEQGLAELAGVVDTVITIPNDQLLSLVPKGTSFIDAFKIADDVLRQAVQGISDIITTPGLVNRDFSDIRTIMTGMGYAMMGTATARGEHACTGAAEKAITSPLMEAGGVRGAKGILINISGSSKLGLHEVSEACNLVRAAAENDDVQINFGVVLNESMGEEVKVTVIATGFERDNLPRIERRNGRYDAAAAPPVETHPMTAPPMAASPAATATPAQAPPFTPPPSPNVVNQSGLTQNAPPPAAPQVPLTAAPPAAYAAAAAAQSQPPPVAYQSAPEAPPVAKPPAAPPAYEDDVDIPAILRRDRRMVQ